MATYVGEGRVTDLNLFAAVTVTDPHDIGQVGRTVYSQHGDEFTLVIAGGTIPAAGKVFWDQTDPGDALAVTNALLAALASDAERKAQKFGCAQAAATAGQAVWVCTKKVGNEQADIQMLAAAATAAGAAVATTATPGAIDDAAGVGSYTFEGVNVLTDPGSGIAFDTVVWPNGITLASGTAN